MNKVFKKIGFYFFLAIVMIPVVFPLVWIGMSSLKTQQQIITLPPRIFFAPTLENFRRVFLENNFSLYLLNSSVIALFSTLFSLVLALPAAYSISRYHQKKLSMFILVARLMPGVSLLIPWFIIFSRLKLTDTYIILIASHMLVALPLMVWIMVSFIDDLPYELEEAALIDGCGKAAIFLRIVLPLSSPGIITCSTLSFIFSWNNFMFSLALSASKTKTLPIAIYNFVSYAEVSWGSVMAAAVVIMAPAIVLTMLLQKYVIRGLTAGAVKG